MTPLVFLHGWGQSAQIWHGQRQHFSPDWPISMPNLPGHGGTADAPASEWAETLLASLPEEPSILVGWSLGGMMAMQMAAAFPQRIAGLVLVSTTPCFRSKFGWEHGCPDAVFRNFESGVKENLAKAMSRFFALMLHGDDLTRPEYNAIARAAVDRTHPVSADGLRQGLSLLGDLDLRDLLNGIKAPCLIMHGDQDAVVPPAAGEYLASHISGAAFEPFEGCGHALFLTQAGKFNQRLEGWCRNIM